jgi:hypothetical protein
VFHPRGTLSLSIREEDSIVRACIGLAALVSQSRQGPRRTPDGGIVIGGIVIGGAS